MKQSWIEMLQEFHEKFEVDWHDTPEIPTRLRVNLRAVLIDEEVQELQKAIDESDIIEIADGICDLIYVLIGTAGEYGFAHLLDECFREVHRSNMSKLWNGEVKKREDGKVIKSPNYSPADFKSILYDRT